MFRACNRNRRTNEREKRKQQGGYKTHLLSVLMIHHELKSVLPDDFASRLNEKPQAYARKKIVLPFCSVRRLKIDRRNEPTYAPRKLARHAARIYIFFLFLLSNKLNSRVPLSAVHLKSPRARISKRFTSRFRISNLRRAANFLGFYSSPRNRVSDIVSCTRNFER